VGVERAGLYPTVGLQAAIVTMTPVPDFGEAVTWRVGLGATVPLFQGGVVAGRVDQAQAQAAQARAGVRAAREGAELEVRMAHGALSQALSSLEAHDEAVLLAQRAVEAAERRLDDGGGSLLQLQQAQLELIGAEASRTRARSAAGQAADLLDMAVRGSL
jgi:multidrug efflux system outer membrane protein